MCSILLEPGESTQCPEAAENQVTRGTKLRTGEKRKVSDWKFSSSVLSVVKYSICKLWNLPWFVQMWTSGCFLDNLVYPIYIMPT